MDKSDSSDAGEEAKDAAPDAEYGDDDGDVVQRAVKNYHRGAEKERENIDAAYEDLIFRAGEQWPAEIKLLRNAGGPRPCLTVNLIPQFIRQVTGDIRQMRPAMHVLPIDDDADQSTADTIAGMIRYIESRSEAQAAYYNAADSAVTCGIGAAQIVTEYASQTTMKQELRIKSIDDAVAVIWDPDSVEANFGRIGTGIRNSHYFDTQNNWPTASSFFS